MCTGIAVFQDLTTINYLQKTVTNFAFMEACTDVLASNPDAANLVHTSGFGKNELSLEDRLNSTEFMTKYKNTRSVKKLMDYYASNFAK